MSRPTKPPQDQHTLAVKVYLTDQEYETLSGEARKLGLPLSAYIRAVCLLEQNRPTEKRPT